MLYEYIFIRRNKQKNQLPPELFSPQRKTLKATTATQAVLVSSGYLPATIAHNAYAICATHLSGTNDNNNKNLLQELRSKGRRLKDKRQAVLFYPAPVLVYNSIVYWDLVFPAPATPNVMLPKISFSKLP